ncbi:MAG: cation transporter [Bacteroidales bacterium]|nr:cation transporter [Bacteroidales bacterium]
MDIRIKEIKTASWIGIFGNGFLAVLKIAAGILSGSLAVVGDGIDSSTDILTSIITLITAKIISKPPNTKFPYGYGKADAIATKAVSFIVFFAGIQLLITSVKKLIEGGSSEMPAKLAIIVTMISIFIKFALALVQFRVGKKTSSSMLIANGKNMQNDVLISVSVLVGLIFTFVFHLPVFDTITALLVSIWILKVAFQIFMESNVELMDGTADRSIYKEVFNAIDSVPGAKNPHRMRVRKIGNQLMIATDIEVDGGLTLLEAHKIAHEVEDSIKEKIEDVFDVAIHIEPIGNEIKEKDLGLSRETLVNE